MTYPQMAYGQPQGLDAPLYGASIGQAFSRFFQKYATFAGRASRSEFWWVFLVFAIVGIVGEILDIALSGGVAEAQATTTGLVDIVFGLINLATLVPTLALGARRLHDTNRSGWWQLLYLTLIGVIVLIVFWALQTKPEGARFDKGGAPAGHGAPDQYGAQGQYGQGQYGAPNQYGQGQYGAQGQYGPPGPYGQSQPGPDPYGPSQPGPDPYGPSGRP